MCIWYYIWFSFLLSCEVVCDKLLLKKGRCEIVLLWLCVGFLWVKVLKWCWCGVLLWKLVVFLCGCIVILLVSRIFCGIFGMFLLVNCWVNCGWLRWSCFCWSLRSLYWVIWIIGFGIWIGFLLFFCRRILCLVWFGCIWRSLKVVKVLSCLLLWWMMFRWLVSLVVLWWWM